jgi:hypothetical protein
LALTEVGSTREYFGDAATYLQPHSTESIAQAIGESLQQTPEQTAALAQLGASYTWPQVVKKLKDLYDQF